MRRDKGKHKFICYKCGQMTWGKLSTQVICGVCKLPMMPADNKEKSG